MRMRVSVPNRIRKHIEKMMVELEKLAELADKFIEIDVNDLDKTLKKMKNIKKPKKNTKAK